MAAESTAKQILNKAIGRSAQVELRQPKLLITIVERGKGKDIIRLYRDCGVHFHYQTIAKGTATSEIMDILGLDSSEKDVVFSFAAKDVMNQLVADMNRDLRGRVKARGILFDIPLDAMNQLALMCILQGNPVVNATGKEKKELSAENKDSLILVTVNQGYTEEVMDTARKQGARGGTVFRARWSGDENIEQVHGLHLQTEKEIIFIVVPKELRNQIMDAINETHGLKTSAQAMVCSAGVDHLVRL